MLEYPPVKGHKVLVPVRQTLCNYWNHSVNIKPEQGAACPEWHHIGHYGMASGVVLKAMFLYRSPDNIVVAQGKEQYIIATEIVISDAGFGINDDGAARNDIMQMPIV